MNKISPALATSPSISQTNPHDAQTVCELMVRRAAASADKTACQFKRGGRWESTTYGEYGRLVREAALGLMSLGAEPGTRMSVWGDTSPEWTILDLATMAIGGATAGIYQTNTPDQGAYIINDSNSRIVAVDGLERLEKAMAVREKSPQVQFYVTWGEGADDSTGIYSFSSLLERGRQYAAENPTAYEDAVANVQPDDTAVIIYTSGTTGPPKGAALSHSNCLFTARMVSTSFEMAPEGSSMAFLPMSHVAEHVVSFVTRIYVGTTGYFAPDVKKIADNVKECGPTIFSGVPRVFEKVYAAVMSKAESSPPLRQKLFHWALEQGKEVAKRTIGKDEPIPPGLAIRHKVADKLVLSKIREALGGKVKFIGCGAAPIDINVIEFFNACGIPFYEVYGMTECSGISHMNLRGVGQYKAGTVGRVVMETECRIAEDGEILVRGPGVFQGYLNKPEATAETVDSEGWLHTGDVGVEDEDGFLTITDRKKNLLITAGGKNVAPSNIELLVNRDPVISQVVVVGDRKPYLVALVTLSAEEMEKSGISRADGEKRVKAAVDQANAELARYEQIKYYTILDSEFTVEDGEMTPTLKLKRNVIIEHYGDVIAGMYAHEAPGEDSEG